MQSQEHKIINSYNRQLSAEHDTAKLQALCKKANGKIAVMLKNESQAVLNNVLFESGCLMKNAFSRLDT